VEIHSCDPLRSGISAGPSLAPGPKKELYVANSGTFHAAVGLLAAQKFESTLTGDPLFLRADETCHRPLKQMGGSDRGRRMQLAPLKGKGRRFAALDARLPIASAQVKSALLLAGLTRRDDTRFEPRPLARPHGKISEIFRREYPGRGSERFHRQRTSAGSAEFRDRRDISSAAFFMAAAALVPEQSFISSPCSGIRRAPAS